MIASPRTTAEPGPLHEIQELAQDASQEIERLRVQFAEINMLAKQTASEVDRLESQADEASDRMREAEVTPDNFTRAEMREIYAKAHESEMRLFVMKGQVEQLEYKKERLQEEQERLQRLLDIANKLSTGDTINLMASVRENQETRRIGLEGDAAQPIENDLAKLIEAQEGERQRIARRVHDGPAQALANLILRAEICERLLAVDPEAAKSELTDLKGMVAGTLRDTRQFIFDLRPMILDDLGLAPTLRRYGEALAAKSNVQIKVSVSGPETRLPAHIEIALFRIVQEAIDNSIEHGKANAIQLSVEIAENVIRITVDDNGAGFDPATVNEDNGSSLQGIRGMRERAQVLGGRLSIDSVLGRGTRITVETGF